MMNLDAYLNALIESEIPVSIYVQYRAKIYQKVNFEHNFTNREHIVLFFCIFYGSTYIYALVIE